ncbi:MAG: ornithine cyclodeaminase family protein [Acidobacteria bacterium]|nr:ornithine cyclodeaminase family protein [Acidobacteriota bacterium]
MEDAIESVEEGFRQMARGGASMVPRFTLSPPQAPGHFYLKWLMPGTLHGMSAMGAKILIAPAPGASPSLRGRFLILLFDSKDGSLLAEIAGQAFTRIRTGAVTAVGTKYLSRADSSTLALLGSSKLAQVQARAICAVRPIKKIKVYSPTRAHREQCAQELGKLLKVEALSVDRSEDAVSGSDILVTVSNSREPILRGALLPKGIHINAVGSGVPDHRELDDTTLLRSKIVLEHLEQVLKESGDLVIPIRNGVITPKEVHAEISEIIVGKKPGRVSPEEITLFKTTGIAIEDIACALKVYQRARERGQGVDFGSL